MKKIITTVLLICVSVVSALAVTVTEAVGVFKGDLNIGGDPYPNKEVYILPGIEENTITFVLPDFKFGAVSLGDIVLMNIPIDANGQLSLNDATLYIKAISERAEIDVINGLEDGGDIYNSVITESDAMVLLSIAAPSLPEPIFVLFTGSKETGKNYEITNGGFEGSWSGGEPTKWHSFPSATGFYASMAGGEDQFKQSNETRPGSTGSHSALIASNLIAGVKANGNCTNGQINAGSMTADSPADNYNFSDPANNGYNTAFVGQPDSLVFWAKYIPADKNPSNSVNKARAHAVITTNARYQDPEAKDYSSVKIAEATINYSATSSMGWQRFAIPFEYTAVDPSQAAYMLITFTTNMTPGGGSTYSTGGFFNKKYYYDNIYLDDAEMIYNHSLASLTKDGTPVTFTNNQATSSDTYSDSDYDFVATTDGKAAKSFIGYDPEKSQVHVYVVADNYSQAGTYSLYTLQMVKPVYNTEYAYSATTCDNEPYSDELFSGLTENGVYNTTIPNTQGGDSLITLTLTVYPTYSNSEQATIAMDQTYSWQGTEYKDLVPGTFKDTVALKTIHGCDSVYTLELTVEPIDYSFSEELTVCQNEEITWREKTLPTNEAGVTVFNDSLLSIYNTDSVFTLTLTVYPTYSYSEQATIAMDQTYSWQGTEYKDLVPGTFKDTVALKTIHGCDSIYTLELTVEPIDYSFSEELTVCQNEEITWREKTLPTNEAGVTVFNDSLLSIYNTDSVFTLTLTVYPTYSYSEQATIAMDQTYSWQGTEYKNLVPGTFKDTVALKTIHGCDSVYTLELTVEPIDYSFSEELTVCQNEEITWREKTLPTNEAGVTVFHDSLLSIYNTDSVFTLTLTVLPTYRQEDSKTITEGDSEIWEGIDLSVIPAGDSTLLAEYKAVNGCDSVMVLHLTVETKIGTGLFDSNDEKSVAKKVLHNGRIYIIRKDESIYDLLGNKIQ